MVERIRKFRAWLLDRLIPAYSFVGTGPAFCAYAGHKSSQVNGLYVCPLIDPLIGRLPAGSCINVVIGELAGPEAIPSVQLPRRLDWMEFAFSLLFLERCDLPDYCFLGKLYNSQELCRLMRPGRLHESWIFRRLFALRVFLLARYFALKFRGLAMMADLAHVVVYYNPMMLGIVRAFRSVEKPVWDVQHGYLGPDHDAYNNPDAFSLNSSFRPSGFLVWDAYFGEYLHTTLGAQWRSTNYLHLNAYSNPRKGDGVTVMYSLQWQTPVPEEVRDTVQRFKDVQWLFRMHPMDRSVRDDLDWVHKFPNAKLIGSGEPLARALTVCDLHITFNSGVVHEAAALGIPTLFLDSRFTVRVVQEVQSGFAKFVEHGGLESALEAFLKENLGLCREDLSCGTK